MIHTGPVTIQWDEFDNHSCEDTPPDSHYPTFTAAIMAGCWFECGCCGRRTDDDDPRDEDDNELPQPDPVCTVYADSDVVCHVYCSPACHDKDVTDRANANEAKEAMRGTITRLWPDNTEISIWNGWIESGAKGPAQMVAKVETPDLQLHLAVDGGIICYARAGQVTPAIKALADDARAKWASAVRP